MSSALLEEYIKSESDRCLPNVTFPVVYDYVDQSPYYSDENAKFGPFLDEKEMIELQHPQDQGNGVINEPYQKKYYFNPQHLPYPLEQNNLYSHYGSQTQKRSTIAHGPRLNRYYENLKPYYRIDYEKLEEATESTNESGESEIPRLPLDKTLIFESRFESGNLRKVMKVGQFEYEMYCKNDYNTQSFCQWYFFRIQNTRKG